MTPEQAKLQFSSGQPFRHYKGGIYTFLFVGRHSETEDWYVVYQNVNNDIWLRPFEMFFEKVLHDGEWVPRFSALDA